MARSDDCWTIWNRMAPWLRQVLCPLRAAGLSLWAPASGPDGQMLPDGSVGNASTGSTSTGWRSPASNAFRLCVFCPAYLLKHIRDFGWPPGPWSKPLARKGGERTAEPRLKHVESSSMI